MHVNSNLPWLSLWKYARWKEAMNNLLSKVLEAHGGLARWNEFSTVGVQIVAGGGLWALKGLVQDAAPRQMTVSLREEFASVTPFGQPNWRTSFRPERVAIETLDGEVVRERETRGHRSTATL